MGLVYQEGLNIFIVARAEKALVFTLSESTTTATKAPRQAIIATEIRVNLKKKKINKLDRTNNRSGQKSPLATLWKINHFNCGVRHNLGDPINLWLSVEARMGKRTLENRGG